MLNSSKLFLLLGKYNDVIYDDLIYKSPNYCNHTAYMFAFVLLIIQWVVIAVNTSGIFCFTCCSVCLMATVMGLAGRSMKSR